MWKNNYSIKDYTLFKFFKKMLSAIAILSFLFLGNTNDLNAQLASCHSKFVGNIWYNSSMPTRFNEYFNQLTPENATKWSAVQGSGSNSWNWGDATAMYNYCKSNGIPFKFHTLVWGNQYPSWVDEIYPYSDKAIAVENWIRAASQTFPDCEYIDVVNECLPNHAQPDWRWDIGGDNGIYGTGWDWVVWSFEKARQYFPNSKLLINDYNILNNSWNNDLDVLCQIVNILSSRGLIDGIGLQSHGLENTSGSDLTARLNSITSQCPGVDIYISEFDLDIADDNQQRNKMAELFPIFWNNPAIKGITLWGYDQGHTWIPNSHLIRSNGSERPAMVWLKDYLSCNGCDPSSITPYVQVNDGNWQQTSSVTVDAGAKIVFGPQPTSGGSWSWSGGGTSGSSREQTIYPNNSITATATYTNGCGAQSTQNFNVIVNGSGGAIALQGNNGNYVSSENGESAMNCNRTSIGSWEKFEVVDAGDGKIALRGNNGMYVSSENGQNPMNCNRTSIGSWEKFTRIDAGEGKYALQGNNGMYVSSENGTSAMNCNRTSIGEWEKFNWVPTTKSAVLNDDASLTRTLELDVYPNPSTDGYFTVSITNNDDENFKLSVYSTDGRKVFGVDAYSDNTQLDLSNLKSGMYILNIEGATKVWTKKLLKN